MFLLSFTFASAVHRQLYLWKDVHSWLCSLSYDRTVLWLQFATAGAQAFLRFGSGAFVSGKLDKFTNRPKQPIELYEFEVCPSAALVRSDSNLAGSLWAISCMHGAYMCRLLPCHAGMSFLQEGTGGGVHPGHRRAVLPLPPGRTQLEA